jgi:acyl carrier protein
MEREKQICNIMSQIFDIPLSKISLDSTPENRPEWDSLSHINLVLALETEFGVTFTPEQMAKIFSVKDILKVLEELKGS